MNIVNPHSLGLDAMVIRTLVDPPARHVAVTPSDTTTYDPPLRAVYCGGAGNLVLTDLDGTDCTYVVAAGQQISGFFTKVKAATSATSLVGRY
jgi:hypothetical protein